MKPNIGQGDKGKTKLFGKSEKVWKNDPQVEAYGDADALNSLIGHIRAINPHKSIDPFLEKIQQDLFILQSLLATEDENPAIPHLTQGHIDFLEEKLQEIEDELPELKNFILPSGTETAALMHRARTESRNLERTIVSFYRATNYFTEDKIDLPKYLGYILPYANRLSDIFFALARWTNLKENVKETEWRGTEK